MNESRNTIETTFKDNNKSFQMHWSNPKMICHLVFQNYVDIFHENLEMQNLDKNPEMREIYWFNQGM